MEDCIAIEEVLPTGGFNFFIPQWTGRMGYLRKAYVPGILRDKKSIQVKPDIFERLKSKMKDVSDISYRN